MALPMLIACGAAKLLYHVTGHVDKACHLLGLSLFYCSLDCLLLYFYFWTLLYFIPKMRTSSDVKKPLLNFQILIKSI